MIAIVSSNRAEREALTVLCENRGWPVMACDGVGAFRKALWRTTPAVVLVRHQLRDGFADDVMRVLEGDRTKRPRLIVLLPASTPPAIEARPLALGADYVQRDPVRADVIAQYILRCLASATSRGPGAQAHQPSYQFAGAMIDLATRNLRCGRRTATLTPREIELLDVLHRSAGRVVTYDTLYDEILGRPFRGDSSNLRVLLGKLDASFRGVGLRLREHVLVIAKTGYLYREPAAIAPRKPPMDAVRLRAR